ncbi:VWA domain-containing protein [Enterococcus sp.]|uniref:VWA domain-containing protein n=1 Tax=Enterococcus sp. TaxID=35783 RepID=UPI003C7375BD
MVKRKKFIILAVAIILMPFLENLLGLGQIFGAFAQAEATSGETVLSDPNGRLTVVKDSEEEADGNMVWNLTMRKANDENESSKLKVSLTDETAAQGVTLTGDGFQTSGVALVENDFTDDERKMTITAPVGVTVNLSVDYDLRKEIMPAAKMDSESDSEEDGEPASPVTETTENVISANNTDAGAIKLETPADVLEAKAAEEAAQAEAEAKAAEEAAQAEAEAKAAEEAAQAEADAKAKEEAAQAKAAEEAIVQETTTDDTDAGNASQPESEIQEEDEEVANSKVNFSTFNIATGKTVLQNETKSDESELIINKKDKSAYLTDWKNREYNIEIDVELVGKIKEGAARVVMVADVSGSMTNNGSKALSNLKTTAKKFVEDLSSTDSEIAIVKYSDLATAVTVSGTPTSLSGANTGTATRPEFWSVKSKKADLNQKIDGLTANGKTRSDLGLQLAYLTLKDNVQDTRPVYVIFLSDGQPTLNSGSYDTRVAQRAKEWADMIKGDWKEQTFDNYSYSEVQTATIGENSNATSNNVTWSNVDLNTLSDEIKQQMLIIANQVGTSTTNRYLMTEYNSATGNWQMIRFKVGAKASGSTAIKRPGNAGTIQSFTAKNVTVYNSTPQITNSTPVLSFNPTAEIYAIQQASNWTDTTRTFMEGIASKPTADRVFLASDEEKMNNVFSEIVKHITKSGVKDVIDPRFELNATPEELKTLTDAGMVIKETDNGIELSWNPKPDTDGKMVVKATIPIRAKDHFAGANAVPTNVSSLSGIFSGSGDEGYWAFDVDKETGISTPYVNVKLKELKDVQTSEGPHEPGAVAMAQEDIKNGWMTQTQLTDGTDYDSNLGDYPEVKISGISDYEQTARKIIYSETSEAKAEQVDPEKGDEDHAGAYADGFGQGTVGDASSKMEGNKVVANLTHEVKVKAVPELVTNQKDAKLINWNDRTYQVDIKTKVEYEALDPYVLLILDRSLSMTDTRLASMKSAATGLVTSLKTTLPDAQVGVISFSNNAVKEHDFAAVGEKASAINNAIRAISRNGYTYTGSAFEMAYDMLSADSIDKTKPVYIMFLTDGQPQTSGSTSNPDFSKPQAAKAESYASLIRGITMIQADGTTVGTYDTTLGRNLGVNESPLSLTGGVSIYSVMQGTDYGTKNTADVENFMKYIADSGKALIGDGEDLTKIFKNFGSDITGYSVVDTLDPHFELSDKEIKRLEEEENATIEVVDGVTTITWPAKLNEEFTTSFTIQAKEDYVGENVVPTNVPDESGIIINNGEPTRFDIYDEDGKVDDLTTPYVNVKLKDFTVKSTDETIWLGTIASTQAHIFTGWKDTVTTPDAGADGAVYPTPVFSKDPNKLTGYESKPLTEKTYTDTATATAATNSDGENAYNYAEGYGLGGVTAGKGETNKVSKDVNHTVKLETDSVGFDKKLNGEEIGHQYGATFDIVEPASYPAASVSFVRANTNDSYNLEISGLGVGTYTINETTPKGIKTASWTLVVGSETTKYPTELTYTLKSVEGEKEVEVTVLDNYWNDFKIRVQKKDDLGQALLGAEFTLTNVTDPASPGTPVPLGTDGNLSTFDFGGLAPGTYKLEETKTPKGHTGLADPITIVIGKDGVVKIDGAGEEWVVEEGSNVITLDVTNKVKGVLPSTGGPGRQMFSVIALILMLSVAGISVIYVHRNRKGGA